MGILEMSFAEALLLILKFIVGMSILLTASEVDKQTRKVPNSIWKIGLITVVPLILIDFYMSGRYYMIFWMFSILATVLTSLIVYSITKSGGADYKALIFISSIHPFMGDTMIPYPIILGFISFTIGLIYAITFKKGKEFAFIPFITMIHAGLFIMYLF